MATPSAAQVFTGVSGSRADNSGSAVVLDQAQDFQPIADAFYRKREAEQVRRAAEQKKADQDWFNLQKGFNPEEVALRDQDEIMSGANEYNDMLVDLKMSGANPQDYYSDAGKKAREKEFQIRNLTKASGENQKYDGLVAAAIEKKDPSMDRAYAVDWLKRYRALPSIEAQAKMRQEENPFKTVFSFSNVVDRVPPPTAVNEKGLKTTKGLNADDYKKALILDLERNPSAKSDYELWSNSVGNEGKTPQDYVNEVVEYARGIVDTSVTYQNPPKVASPTSDSDGAGKEKNDLEVTMSYNPSFDPKGTMKGTSNTLTFTPKNQNMKPVVLFEGDKQYVATGQLAIHPNKEGTAYVIEADVIDAAEVAESTGNPFLDAMASGGGKKTKRMTFPIDHRENQVGNENYRILSDRSPQEIQNYIGQPLGKGDGAKQNSGEAKPKMTGESMIGLDGKKYVKK
jgi:hypothetical protein